MKISSIVIVLALTFSSCAKRESISDFPEAPNTSAQKDGSMAGQGSATSLGSENPGGPNNPETAPTPVH